MRNDTRNGLVKRLFVDFRFSRHCVSFGLSLFCKLLAPLDLTCSSIVDFGLVTTAPKDYHFQTSNANSNRIPTHKDYILNDHVTFDSAMYAPNTVFIVLTSTHVSKLIVFQVRRLSNFQSKTAVVGFLFITLRRRWIAY